MTDETHLEAYKVAIDMYKMEKDQYWTRSNVFLVIQSALLVVFSSDRAVGELGVFISFIGLILSTAWLAISLHSEYYIKTWREIVRKVEVELPVQPFMMFPKDSIRFGKRFSGSKIYYILWPVTGILGGGPSRIMNLVISIITLMWLVLGLLAVFPDNKVSNVLGISDETCLGGLLDDRFCKISQILLDVAR